MAATQECSVCQDLFAEPKILPCGHTFCNLCIQSWADKTAGSASTISCPLCQQDVALPEQGINGLPTNYDLMETISNAAKKDLSGLKCGNCEVNSMKFKCIQCKEFLCQQCKDMHLQIKAIQSHTFLTKKTLESDTTGKEVNIESWRYQSCIQHHIEEKFFCSECTKAVCSECVALEHRPHDVTLMDEKAKVMIQSIKDKVTLKKVSINSSKCTHLKAKKQNDKYIEVTKEAVKKRAAIIIEAVQHHCDQVLTKLNTDMQEFGSNATMKVKRLDDNLHMLGDVEDKVKTVVDTKSPQLIIQRGSEWSTIVDSCVTHNELDKPKVKRLKLYEPPKILEDAVADMFGHIGPMEHENKLVRSFRTWCAFRLKQCNHSDITVLGKDYVVIPCLEHCNVKVYRADGKLVRNIKDKSLVVPGRVCPYSDKSDIVLVTDSCSPTCPIKKVNVITGQVFPFIKSMTNMVRKPLTRSLGIAKSKRGGLEVVYVADCYHPRVVIFTMDGQEIDSISLETEGHKYISVWEDKHIVVNYGWKKLAAYDLSGKQLWNASYASLGGMHVLNSGYIITADYSHHSVSLLTPKGDRVQKLLFDIKYRPLGICYCEDKAMLFVAYQHNGFVSIYEY